MGFSLFYFAADAGDAKGGRYRLLLEGARFADTHDFEAVWTPERHFHPFGGLYPNPSLTGAALAVIDADDRDSRGQRRTCLCTARFAARRSGPSSTTFRAAASASRSRRAGTRTTSRWRPGNFKDRRDLMARGIETVRALWRGEAVAATSGDGRGDPGEDVPAAGAARARDMDHGQRQPGDLRRRGAHGGQDSDQPARDEARGAGGQHRRLPEGLPGGRSPRRWARIADAPHVRRRRRRPTYARRCAGPSSSTCGRPRTSSTRPGGSSRPSPRATAAKTGDSGATRDLDELSTEEMNAILAHAFERYFTTAGLFGTPETCLATVERMRAMGVDEIACLDRLRGRRGHRPRQPAAPRRAAHDAVRARPSATTTGATRSPPRFADTASRTCSARRRSSGRWRSTKRRPRR